MKIVMERTAKCRTVSAGVPLLTLVPKERLKETAVCHENIVRACVCVCVQGGGSVCVSVYGEKMVVRQ